MADLRAEWEHMAEIEWMERYYGIDTSTPDCFDTVDRDIDLHDNEPEFAGYWPHVDDFTDTDWPADEYQPAINWDDIPF